MQGLCLNEATREPAQADLCFGRLSLLYQRGLLAGKGYGIGLPALSAAFIILSANGHPSKLSGSRFPASMSLK